MSAEVDKYLAHYGVKGMRWGRRRGSVEISKKSKKSPIDKDKLSAARKDLYGGVKKHYKSNGQKVLGGAAIVSSILTGGSTGSMVVGAQMMRGAGFSKGKSFAMGMLGGAPGAALAIELKARKIAREDD